MTVPENEAAGLPEGLSRILSPAGEGRAWKNISAVRLSQLIEKVASPASSSHCVLVNVGPPYVLEERLDGRVYRTPGMRGDVAVNPAG